MIRASDGRGTSSRRRPACSARVGTGGLVPIRKSCRAGLQLGQAALELGGLTSNPSAAEAAEQPSGHVGQLVAQVAELDVQAG